MPPLSLSQRKTDTVCSCRPGHLLVKALARQGLPYQYMHLCVSSVLSRWCEVCINALQVLDSALLRPGRFDRRVSVERPDRMGREQILRVHIERRQLPLSDDVSVGMVASSTVGFTGADLANLVNEAALLAGRDSKGASSFNDVL